MTPLSTSAKSVASSLVALGALTTLMLAGSTADAGDLAGDSDGARVITAASRCAAFGPGFVDLGDGTCVRPTNHVRVQLGTHTVASDTWTAGATSSAALRSEGSEFVPGVGASHQLRVRNGLQTLNPY